MHIEHSSKKSRFFAGGGSAAPSRLPIAKAKATPHAMRSNMPGIRCLVHRRIYTVYISIYIYIYKQASACQPPTRRNIARAASTVFISRLIHMLYYCSTGFHIIKNPRKHKHRQFHFAFNGNGNKRLRHAIRCFVLVPAFEGLNSESGWCAVPACPSFLWKLSPDFHDTGPETGARFPAKPSAGNRCPIGSARGGNRACYLSVVSLGACQL